MAVFFTCDCGRVLQVLDELAGQKYRCKACGATMTVPVPAGSPAPAREAASGVPVLGRVEGAEPCPHCGGAPPRGRTVCGRCGWDGKWNVRACAKCGKTVEMRAGQGGVLGVLATAGLGGLALAWLAGAIGTRIAAGSGAGLSAAFFIAAIVWPRDVRFRCRQCKAVTRPVRLSESEEESLEGRGAGRTMGLAVLALLAVGLGVAAWRAGGPSPEWTPAADVAALEAMGASGVPELAKALGDDRVCLRAAEALVRIGRPSVPATAVALKAGSEQARLLALEVLGELGSEAEEAVPALAEALKDRSSEVRLRAAAVLGKVGTKASAAAPALKEALKDWNADVRREAEKALSKVGGQ